MKNKYTLFLAVSTGLLFAVLTSNAQITFQKSYGGANDDIAYSVVQTRDSGYIMTGYTLSDTTGIPYVYLVKTNAHGDTLWTRAFGGGGVWSGSSVEQTTDNGYIITGVFEDSSFAASVLLIKTDANGDTLWTKSYGATGEDIGAFVQQTKDGGYIITGASANIMYLVKTDMAGDTLWTKTYSSTGSSNGLYVQQTFDGGYIIAGSEDSTYNDSLITNYNVYIVKTDSLGNILWTSAFGDDSSGNSVGNSVFQTKDSGFVVAGYTTLSDGGNNVYLIRMQSNGDTLWTKSYSGRGFDQGQSVQQTTDGGFVIAGVTSATGNDSVYVIKTDFNGDILWAKAYSGTNYSYGYSVQQTFDGGYIIGGSCVSSNFYNDFYLIKTDSAGNVQCDEVDLTTIEAAAPCLVGTPAITIGTNTALSPIYPGVISLGTVTSLCVTTGVKETIATNSFFIYPNPASNQLYIKSNQLTGASAVIVFNVLGEVLISHSFADIEVEPVDISAFSSGVYFVKVVNGNKQWIAKFVKE